MNRVFLIGNATRDPETNTTQNGVSVCKFGLAVSRRFGKDETDFFNIVAWRGQAENCQKFVKKGDKVAIAGSIQMNEYTAQDGSKRTAVDVIADEVQFLTPKTEHKPDMNKLRAVEDDEQLPF